MDASSNDYVHLFRHMQSVLHSLHFISSTSDLLFPTPVMEVVLSNKWVTLSISEEESVVVWIEIRSARGGRNLHKQEFKDGKVSRIFPLFWELYSSHGKFVLGGGLGWKPKK